MTDNKKTFGGRESRGRFWAHAKLFTIHFSLFTLLLSGCGWEPLEVPDDEPAKNVFVMYDNIRSDWFGADVAEAGAAVAAGVLGAGDRVLVFQRHSAGNAIYELVKDSSTPDGYAKQTWKQFERGEYSDLSPASIEAVVGVMRDQIFPEAANWGLAFGSHGSGWLPEGVSTPTRAGVMGYPPAPWWDHGEGDLTRAFARNTTEQLDVSEFVEALDGWRWDFMILDDCFMSSVEVLYEMRGLTDYIIASPTEIMGAGFPYDRIVKTVFNDWSGGGFAEVGRQYIDFYTTVSYTENSGTIAVVKTDQLGALAQTVAAMNLTFNELTSVDGLQYYEAYANPAHLFYDLDDYLGRVRGESSPELYDAFAAQLGRTVVYAGHTDRFFSDFPKGSGGTFVDVTHFSGVNVFIPWSKLEHYFDHYRTMDWYKAVYSE